MSVLAYTPHRPDISYTVVPCAASASNSSTGVFKKRSNLIHKRTCTASTASVHPHICDLQLARPFIPLEKIIFASCPPSSIAVPISPYMASQGDRVRHYLLYIRIPSSSERCFMPEPVIAVRNDRPASVSFTNFTALDTL